MPLRRCPNAKRARANHKSARLSRGHVIAFLSRMANGSCDTTVGRQIIIARMPWLQTSTAPCGSTNSREEIRLNVSLLIFVMPHRRAKRATEKRWFRFLHNCIGQLTPNKWYIYMHFISLLYMSVREPVLCGCDGDSNRLFCFVFVQATDTHTHADEWMAHSKMLAHVIHETATCSRPLRIVPLFRVMFEMCQWESIHRPTELGMILMHANGQFGPNGFPVPSRVDGVLYYI